MAKSPAHLSWLVNTGKQLKTACGSIVEILELNHTKDAGLLSEWAKHFRNQYCVDSEIDILKGKSTRKEFLENIKFPSKTEAPGPSIRAGDFSEILFADYLEWRLGYWVPRVRWDGKVIRNESSKGCDIIGFHVVKAGVADNNDVLAIMESKANLSGANENVLQTAVKDSAKDEIRKAESLNYMRQRFLREKKIVEGSVVERFQSPVDVPYKELRAAAAAFSNEGYSESAIKATDASSHPHYGQLKLIVIKGGDLMSLVHELYQRAADEA